MVFPIIPIVWGVGVLAVSAATAYWSKQASVQKGQEVQIESLKSDLAKSQLAAQNASPEMLAATTQTSVDDWTLFFKNNLPLIGVIVGVVVVAVAAMRKA